LACTVAVVESDARQVLKELRAARRRQRIADFDPFEALYQAYLTGIVLIVVVLVLSAVTGDGKVAADQVARIRQHGAAYVGAAAALAFAIGLRSGGRGGPLVVEAADVRHVLMAPVDRRTALWGTAIRQFRFMLLIGGGAGAVAGLLAFRRLPGAPFAWVVCGVVVGVAAVVGGFGMAMLVSGLRLGRWIGGSLSLLVLAWSALDIVQQSVTSPASLLGQLALWPLKVHVVDVLGVVVALAFVPVGFSLIGGTSLEASERRAGLVGQIRFAATLQDLRTVIVLRRQLAQELPRQRPWIRLPRPVGRDLLLAAGGSRANGTARRIKTRHLPVWRRGWHGILRWPALRFARMAVLGAGAGLALVGVWRGTTPLVVVAGLALYIAGLDAAEPIAQEVDHPDRRDEYPLDAGSLHLRQLGPPIVLMLLVGAIGLGAAAVATGGATLTWEVGGLIAAPAVLAALGGAIISVIKGPPPPLSPQVSLMPEAAGARAMGRLLWPPVMAIVGVLPLLGARSAFDHHHQAVAGAAPLVQLVIVLVMGWIAWVRWQEPAHVWMAKQMEMTKAQARGQVAGGQ
jgi:hypothetical protein